MYIDKLSSCIAQRPLGCCLYGYFRFTGTNISNRNISTYRNLSVKNLFSRNDNAISDPSSAVTVFSGTWNLGCLFSQRRGPKLAKPRDLIRFWKIKVGDKVEVISGKDKGKVGEVLACDKLRNQVKVKGCNMRKLLVDGQPVMIEKKLHYSNVQLMDPLLNCATRVAIRYNKHKEPLRVSKKSGYVIPWPEEKAEPDKDLIEGEKDTKPEVALERTYNYKMVRTM
ncbi:hypothetical protein BgAZ_207110 [Babesia gibsoni]|uniref:Large ribosomal subunit protein uL24c n=1 Tax=Babesia gibsoni TaxID=33632 RepID=A0AAD8PEF0_BABGI|nr:hypothetical protein BgAZ_207110 [Babesia gibsoni]